MKFSRRNFIWRFLPIQFMSMPFLDKAYSKSKSEFMVQDRNQVIYFTSQALALKSHLCIINYINGPYTIKSLNQVLYYNGFFYTLSKKDISFGGYATTGITDLSWAQDKEHFDMLPNQIPCLVDSTQVFYSFFFKNRLFRSLDSKLKEQVSVLDFIPEEEHLSIRERTSSYDCTEDFRNASIYAFSLGARVFIPAGMYIIKHGGIDPYLGVVGAGISSTIIKLMKNSNGVFDATGFWGKGPEWRNNVTCTMEDFSIIGGQDDFFQYDSSFPNNYDSSSATKETPIKLAFYHRVILKKIQVVWSRGFSFLVTRNREVYIDTCFASYSMKDAFRVLANESLKVVNCFVKHCGDDAITCGTNWNGEDVKPWGDQLDKTVIVTGNTIIDSKGIRCLGALNTNISDNILQRPKEYGILIGGVDGSEGLNDSENIIVCNNIINDVISGESISESGGSNAANNSEWNSGIVIMTRSISSDSLSSPLGTFTDVSKGIVLPEHSFISSAGKNKPSMGMRNLTISGNKVSRNYEYSGKYSDWRFGSMIFTPTGWIDINVSGLKQSGYGINIRTNSKKSNTAIYGLTVINNDFYCLNIGMDFSSAKYLGFVTIHNNSFNRISLVGICVYNSFFPDKCQLSKIIGLIDIKDNNFNLDPCFKSERRLGNGTWQGDIYPCGVDCGSFQDVNIMNNVFSNLCLPVLVNSKHFLENEVNINEYKNNVFIDSVSNSDGMFITGKGVKTVPSGCVLFVEVSDDTDVFSKKKTYNLTSLSSFEMPTKGFYYAGVFVSNTKLELIDDDLTLADDIRLKHKFVISGWLRMTTGNQHHVNVDWLICKTTIDIVKF
ncbi:hypothetical protein [Klebsiella michiganensis]|uniref:hypothetical protein n=1 Tax=Klebsiella michiganensis TaxID=1134687 RepID=UPI002930C6C7|nr:hypothetical protein [Klebsiella michiganensis]